MPSLDSTAITAVENTVVAPAWFIFLDVSGDPVRVTNYASDITFTSTGDSDLDSHTFVSFGGQWLSIGDISNSDGGSDTLNVTLSGITALDTTLINDIGDRTLWQGRTARVWMHAYEETGVTPQGAIVPFYTGFMSSVKIVSAPDGQAIQLSIENWLAAMNHASNRSYLNQKDYDSADTSAAATLAAANGLRRDSGATSGSFTGSTSDAGSGVGGFNDIIGSQIGGTTQYYRNTFSTGTGGFQ